MFKGICHGQAPATAQDVTAVTALMSATALISKAALSQSEKAVSTREPSCRVCSPDKAAPPNTCFLQQKGAWEWTELLEQSQPLQQTQLYWLLLQLCIFKAALSQLDNPPDSLWFSLSV